MTRLVTRRRMLRDTTLAGVGVWLSGGPGAQAQSRSPNEKLNIAAIGIGNRGAADVAGVAGENLVALCDVDDRLAGKTFERFPQARKFRDFRRMLEELSAAIDAVVVGTPDHTHAPAAAMAMRMGKHCYCEKPLAHSVHECECSPI